MPGEHGEFDARYALAYRVTSDELIAQGLRPRVEGYR